MHPEQAHMYGGQDLSLCNSVRARRCRLFFSAAYSYLANFCGAAHLALSRELQYSAATMVGQIRGGQELSCAK